MKKLQLTPKIISIVCMVLILIPAKAQENLNVSKFKQLYDLLPTPNVYRTAAGAPGHAYYQNRADYVMDITLDDNKQRIDGTETITYINNSPDALGYLWLQLDQNMRSKDSDTKKTQTGSVDGTMGYDDVNKFKTDLDRGFHIEAVKDENGKPLGHVINNTMMRVDPATPIPPGGTYTFQVDWWYNINNRPVEGGRSGYEYFEEDDNYLYTIAQFFPRMCVYNEVEGWQNKQFLGRGEFTLAFGDYKVSLTVPADHVVGATGVLQNPKSVLSSDHRKRLSQAEKEYVQPVMIVSEDEAIENEGDKSTDTKTWVYHAENVRDFAFASSRKFIWDAMAVKMGDRTVMAMSLYPKEGNPLWEQYSTKAVAHTLNTYSKYTFDYPYPVAYSVHTDRIGMEYPMICFNGGRPEPDGTYTERTKYGLISVVIHEVGHNYFPMIVNSDERQWTWMDEGLNSFLQYLSEQEWEREYPSRRGPAPNITDYMGGDKSNITPIMTNSESIYQFGNNAYGKPATALNILRETVMGRELFDYAFKEYSKRWMFKHPSPADFFRTMEDASGVDLDWFWRGWFYTTDHVDQTLEEVEWFQVNSLNPDKEMAVARKEDSESPKYISDIRNKEEIKETYAERDTTLLDFYNKKDPYSVNTLDRKEYEYYVSLLDEEEKELLETNDHFYNITVKNNGGLLMPVILEFEFEDGSTELHRIPAEIWRNNDEKVTKVFITEKPIVNITLDPYLEIADINTEDNHWPPKAAPSRFQVFKQRMRDSENPMQREQRSKELEEQLKQNQPKSTGPEK